MENLEINHLGMEQMRPGNLASSGDCSEGMNNSLYSADGEDYEPPVLDQSRIDADLPPEYSDLVNTVRDVLDHLLKLMDIQGKIRVKIGIPVFKDEETSVNPIIFNIEGDDLGILIGRRGQTLDALQYLTRILVSKRMSCNLPVIIDVEGYKLRRYEDLRILALNVAAQVKAKKSSFRLEPMPPIERRIIHVTLANDPDLITESIGEGENRKVVVSPKHRK